MQERYCPYIEEEKQVYYTTDKELIKQIKKYKKYSKITTISLVIFLISLIAGILSTTFSFYVAFGFIGVFLISFIISLTFSKIKSIIYNEYIKIYEASEEYKNQTQAIIDETIRLRNTQIYNKAKEIVDMYYILNNRKLRKEGKLQKLIEYLNEKE